MKGGHTPIHIMRFAPADYVNDPFVRRCYQKRDYRTAAFYPAFLFYSQMEGGDLPADVDELAAMVIMPPKDVRAALKVCVDAGKIKEHDGRLYHKRVRREVAEELEYRREQAELGKKGGRPRKQPPEEGYPKGSLSENQSPPSPSPAPPSAPAPSTDAIGGSVAASVTVPPANGHPPPAAQAPACLDLDHEHGRRLECQVADRAVTLARIMAAQHGTPVELERHAVLEAITGTPSGKTIHAIRGAPTTWLEQTLRSADEFERDNVETDDPFSVSDFATPPAEDAQPPPPPSSESGRHRRKP